jgi:hypothetical protein
MAAYRVDVGKGPSPPLKFELARLFLGLRGGATLSDVVTVDLPVHGLVQLPAGNTPVVQTMPDVGLIRAISDLDNLNIVNLQPAPGGVMARGVVR